MKKLFCFLVICLLNISFCSIALGSEEDYSETYQRGLEGLKNYREGQYIQATPLLRQSLEEGYYEFASAYADICHRRLDGNEHPLEEAALWYVRAAEANDGDVISYLLSLSERLFDHLSEEGKVSALVRVWVEQTLVSDANRGFELYVGGAFKEAAKLLKKASQGNHPLAQELYADICLRQLDGKPHPLLEAALWYVLAARGGSPQSASYILSVININPLASPEEHMNALTTSWIADEVLTCLCPLSPADVNNYLVKVHGRRIYKTSAMKLPYFFNKVAAGIICNLTGRVLTVVNSQIVPISESTPLAFGSGRCSVQAENAVRNRILNTLVRPLQYGPVYHDYLHTLKGLADGSFLPVPSTVPHVHVFYRRLLDSFNAVTSGETPTTLVDLSHREYPWLLAGIRFWKEKNSGRSFPIRSMTEDELIKKLEKMKNPLSEDEIEEIRAVVDETKDPNNKDVWSYGSSSVSSEFDDDVKRFFATPISYESDLVRRVGAHFFQHHRHLSLDCEDPLDLELLKNPFFMCVCLEITLTNIPNSPEFEEIISNSQRYFLGLQRLNMTYKDGERPSQRIERAIHKINKRDIDVNLYYSEPTE